jgi:hypothetical protein
MKSGIGESVQKTTHCKKDNIDAVFWIVTLHSLGGRYQYLKQYTVATFRTEVSGSGKSGCTCRAIWMVGIQNQGRVKKETK